MSRKRMLAGVGALALALGACQGGVQGQTGVPSGLPSGLPTSLPSDLASLVPSNPPTGSGDLNQLFPTFQAQGGSNLTGGGIITDVDGESSVVIGVVAPGAAEMMPIAIVEGDCATQTGQGPTPPPDMFPEPAPSGEAGASGAPSASAATSPDASAAASGSPAASGGPVTFPVWLTPVAVGSSNSVIPVGVDELTASPRSIVIETSPEDATLVACADLREGPPQTAPTPDASAPAASPAESAGAGTPSSSP